MSERIERRAWLAAPVEQVWDVITGDGWLADEVRFELWPGGDAEFRIADSVKSGWVEEAAAPDSERRGGRLSFWWAADGDPATRVELTLEPDERAGQGAVLIDGTRVRVVESRPLDVLDLVGMPMHGIGGRTYGPALVAA
jgi:uncharacterized protein YndB with AHSA1/START domain